MSWAGARGVPYLAADQYVTVADLEAAERRANVRLGPSDALVVHVGRAERLSAEQLPDLPVPRAGVHASVLPWLHDRDISMFAGDCTERLPPLPTAVPLPLHQVGIVAMGLWLIDAALTSDLLATCVKLGRYEFLFCCTVPELPGATGFPVNPVCLFRRGPGPQAERGPVHRGGETALRGPAADPARRLPLGQDATGLLQQHARVEARSEGEISYSSRPRA